MLRAPLFVALSVELETLSNQLFRDVIRRNSKWSETQILYIIFVLSAILYKHNYVRKMSI